MIESFLRKILHDSNNREVSKNILITMLIKGGAMLISILTVPAYVRYFDNDTAYGAWLTIAAVFTWINMFDLGIGNGLRNYLVKSMAEKDDKTSKGLVSSAYVSIGMISVILLAVGILGSFFVNWNAVLNVPDSLVSENVFRKFVQIVFSGVVIHFFFLLINSIFYAIQRTFWPNLLSLITQTIILLYIILPNNGTLEQKMEGLSLVYVIAYNFPLVIASLALFLGKLKNIKPSIKWFNKVIAKKILGLGGGFFVIQIALIALNSSNEVYINSFFRAEDVVQYNYYHRLFYIITVFVSLLAQPIWSAITKAYFERRFHWIKKMWKVLLLIAFICSIACSLLAIIYQPIADIWLGKGKLIVSAMSVTLFAIATIQMTIINLTNCLANGLGRLKYQAIFTVLGAALKFPLTWFFALVIGEWYAVILATVVASLPLMIVQPVYIYRYVNGLQSE